MTVVATPCTLACVLYTLPRFDDSVGTRGPAGTLEYFGGRFLRPEELALLGPPHWLLIGLRQTIRRMTHLAKFVRQNLLRIS